MSDAEQVFASVQPIKPFGVSPKQAAIIENCGVTLIYDRLNRGEYDGYKDGHRTKITLASIERRRANLKPYRSNKSSMPPPPPYEHRRRRRRSRK